MEDMPTSQLCNRLSIVYSEVAHADNATLLHFWIVWIINLPSDVYNSFYGRNPLYVSDVRLFLRMRRIRYHDKGK